MTLAETVPSRPWKRSKTIAILLAVFLGSWTWIYTYSKDAWKATLGLGLDLSTLVSLVFIILISMRTRTEGYEIFGALFLALPIWFGIWLWAIIDTPVKADKWYESFDLKYQERNKVVALLFAIFLGAWTWFYTYHKDAWKFWAGILLVYGGFIFMNRAGYGDYYYAWMITAAIIWLASIVNTATRPTEWYQAFGQV